MNTDILKQKARLAILEKLKQTGMPSPSKEAMDKLSVIGSPSEDMPEESESMNDMGLDKEDEQRMLTGKKKKGPSALVQKLNSLLGK